MTEQQPKKVGAWHLIFYAFFQPTYVARELQPATYRPRLKMVWGISFSIFFATYLTSFLISLILTLFHVYQYEMNIIFFVPPFQWVVIGEQ
ncbi:hypothetical protein [Dictyobacter kobayashii]|uniref:hypothetical protein n=1 Tax=Dictyobacter kobayashii TaxID=2014872 RepID=UPI001386C260|nr:hypothetical protein [Dictyobacter kobayashii]